MTDEIDVMVETPGDDPETSATAAGDGSRPADHAAIERLASTLVPALIARLGTSGLGEIEIRQDGWKLRVRRPAEAARQALDHAGRRPTVHAGPSRAQPGHTGHGHPPAGAERRADTSGNGHDLARARESSVVTSPAVGVYHPRKGQAPGARVRSGDRIGAVDMLGVPQEVVAPVDGVLGESFVEPGEAVEYGQEIVRIEPLEASR